MSSPSPVPALGDGPGLCALFTPELAVAALGGPVDEPTAGVVRGGVAIYCRYVAAGQAGLHVEANVDGIPRAKCEDHAHFLGMRTPVPGVGDVAYHMDRSQMGDKDGFVIAWANGRCATVVIKSPGDQAALLAAADAIAARVLQPQAQ